MSCGSTHIVGVAVKVLRGSGSPPQITLGLALKGKLQYDSIPFLLQLQLFEHRQALLIHPLFAEKVIQLLVLQLLNIFLDLVA